MPGTNLTHDEARERARLITVDDYDVTVDLRAATDQDVATYPSTTVVRFASAEVGASTFLDLIAPSVREITLNGRSVDPASAYDGARIELTDLAERNELRVVADAAYMRTGEGLHRFVDPVDGHPYLYTQFEVPDARRVYATFEQPDLKGAFRLTVLAPADWQVISNSPTPTPEPLEAGAARWAFAPTPPVSTYITALVAGPYHAVTDSYAGARAEIPMAVYCRQSLAKYLDADEVIDVTKKGFAFFEQLFDYPYPFEKYDQLFVPEYNMGAMENAGCVTLRDEYVFRSRTTDASYESRANTILHELAHMWFGDLVTMRWWDDLWLNESFATYAATLCQSETTRWTDAWTTFANTDKTWAYRQDQLPSTHPIAASINDLDDVEVNFDGITYAKGASVLKQLVAWVGREEFFTGLRQYFKKHEWGNATLADLRSCLEETSGRDLTAWCREWLETAGVNTIRADFTTDAAGRFESFAVLQSATAEQPTLRRHRLAIGLYDRSEQGLVRRRRLELDVTGERTEVPKLVGEPQPDLVLLNDDDLTYAKIRLDERSLLTLVDHIGEFSDALPRALCWAAAWDMCRDAEMRPRDFVTLVLAGLGVERDINVVQLLLRVTQQAVLIYTAPDNRERARKEWAAGLRRLIDAAVTGSDHQLAFVRSFAGAAHAPEDIAYLSGILAGTQTIAGLTVDAELRWTLVQSLARVGAIDDAGIDAELARDATITGQEQAAQARAAMPTAEAKQRAWYDIAERKDLANQTHLQTILGFWRAGQEELLEPYVERYLELARTVWEDRTAEIAQHILVGAFPRVLATPETAAKVRTWLDEEHGGTATRRLIGEGLADLERALRAQERDAVE